MLYLYYFFIYAFIGWVVEVSYATLKTGKFSNRGFLCGPICPIYGFGMLLILSIIDKFANNFLDIFLISALFATVIEFIAGFVLEKILNNKWWDYSDEPFNIKGYVCLGFSIKWGIGGLIFISFIHPFIAGSFKFIDNFVGNLILFAFLIYLISDFSITVNTVLKLNKKLERMRKNAEKLKELSEFIGENVHEAVLDLIEKGEDFKEELDLKQDEFKLKTEEFNSIKDNYLKDLKTREFGVKSLFIRHPRLKNNKNNDMLQKHRKHVFKKNTSSKK